MWGKWKDGVHLSQSLRISSQSGFFPDAKMPSWGRIWRQRYAHVDPWHYPPAEACLFQVLEMVTRSHGIRSWGSATHVALG